MLPLDLPAASAALVGEWEQPPPPSLRWGRSDCPQFLGEPLLRKTPPCPGFLSCSWDSRVPCVTSLTGQDDLCDGRHLAQGSEEDAGGL